MAGASGGTHFVEADVVRPHEPPRCIHEVIHSARLDVEVMKCLDLSQLLLVRSARYLVNSLCEGMIFSPISMKFVKEITL